MARFFAVRFSPSDGPDSLNIVEADYYSEAIQKTLKVFHETLDMDGVTEQELSAIDLGGASDGVFVLNGHGGICSQVLGGEQ